MTAAGLPLAHLLRYAALALPLAFVGLPIYVHVPKFYAAQGGIDLALLGAILLGVRLFDCLLDPIIGWCADRYPQHRRAVMVVASAVLAVAYFLLFNPPANPSILWLTATLVVVYVCYSTLMIQYYAAGVTLGGSGHDATRLSSAREGTMLIGVLLASVLPPMLMEAQGAAASYRILALMLTLLLVVGCALSLRLPCFTGTKPAPQLPFSFTPFLVCLHDARIRRVLAVYVVNAIPSAITGTLFLFYAADVLQASDTTAGLLLALYFVAAALAMPAWVALSRRVGRVNTLAIGMGVAIASFLFALTLGAGDAVWFGLICAASGAAAGADLALLPAIYGGALATRGDSSGIGFGLWNVASKLPLALAAGLALPLLAAFGYTPGGQEVTVLSLAYAGLPCLVKLIALALLLAYPPEPRGRP